MKKLLIIPLLLLTVLCNAQFTKGTGVFLKTGSGFMSVPATPVDYCDEYDVVLEAFGTEPDADTKTIQNALVNSLDTMDFEGNGSVWDRMKLFYVLASHDSADAHINWADPTEYTITNPGSTDPNWTQWQGFDFDGANDYLSTTFVFTADSTSPAIGINTLSIGGYVIGGTNTVVYAAGVSQGANIITLRPSNLSGAANTIINSDGGTTNNYGLVNGFMIGSRTDHNVCALYTMQTTHGFRSASDTDESLAMPSTNALTIGAYNTAGTPAGFYNGTISVIMVLNAVTATEAELIAGVIETYMDAIGTGVIE